MLIVVNGGVLTLLLVRQSPKAGSYADALERSNIASTSQALRLANRNVSNHDCNLISINHTALVYTQAKHASAFEIESRAFHCIPNHTNDDFVEHL